MKTQGEDNHTNGVKHLKTRNAKDDQKHQIEEDLNIEEGFFPRAIREIMALPSPDTRLLSSRMMSKTFLWF